jgi:nickel transport protein
MRGAEIGARIAEGRARMAFSANGSTSAARRVAALMLLLTLGDPALAHKLQVFAFAEGARISGSAYFAGGGAALVARIEVRDGEGRVLAELAPDGEGRFVYTAAAPVDHLILAITSDGHQAEWRVPAAELATGFGYGGAIAQEAERPHRRDEPVIVETDASSTSATSVAILDPALESAIERAVARQIRPLREQLVAAEDRIRFQDILGGIGYIMGLTGLALWWTSRRRSGRA